MALTLSGTNGVVGAGFTVDASGVSVTAGVGTFSSLQGSGANLTALPAANLTGTLPALNAASLTSVPAANIVGVVTTGFSGSIIEIDSWKISADFTQSSSHGQYITSNWTRKPSSDHFAKKGTGMTESSGVFTFPRTGLYLIRVCMSVSTQSGNNLAYCGPYIQISTDSGSSYDRVCETYNHAEHGTRYFTISNQAFVSVTNISTFRCRLETEANGNFTVRTSNGNSILDFMRLGDAT